LRGHELFHGLLFGSVRVVAHHEHFEVVSALTGEAQQGVFERLGSTALRPEDDRQEAGAGGGGLRELDTEKIGEAVCAATGTGLLLDVVEQRRE
jgi:hypothetical protein